MRYNGIDVFYKGCGDGKNAVVLLHGWGASGAAMDGVYNSLRDAGRSVYAVDFPGFGKSDFPPCTWGIYDYADCVQYLIGEWGLHAPTIVGHSFGGRVAIILGARGVASRLVLTDAAGCKPKASLRKWRAIRRYKALKKKGRAPLNAGSPDYAALSPAMKQVFVRIVNTHLDGLLPQIHVPTLLFWGKNDGETPLYMAKRIQRKVADCGLVAVDAGHFAYAECARTFHAAVLNFTAMRTKE